MKTKTSKKKKKSMRYKYCVQPPIQITKPYSNFHLLDRKSVLNTESELETILSGAKKKKSYLNSLRKTMHPPETFNSSHIIQEA